MRLPRLHFTVRWLMVAVAIAGLLVSFVVLLRRRAHYQVQMALHRDQEESYLEIARVVGQRLEQLEGAGRQNMGGQLRVYGESIRAQAEYSAAQRAKYQRASDRPWLSVAPDPPKPN